MFRIRCKINKHIHKSIGFVYGFSAVGFIIVCLIESVVDYCYNLV